MSKHTPGPWKAQFSDVSSPWITAERGGDEIGHDVIGSVNQQLGAETEANARLIAAAPTMKEKINNAIGALMGSSEPEAKVALKFLREAVAKAEGRDGA